MPPDPKPRMRIVNKNCLPVDASPATRIEGVRAVGRCPICNQGAGLNRAHVVPKGQRGDDVPENMAWICGDGVMGCHGCLTHGNRVIGHPLTPEQVAERFVVYCRETVPELGRYADEQKYAGWLEDYYLGDQEAAA
jgi:hypothetical protein